MVDVRTRSILTLCVAALALPQTACVKKGTYNGVLDDLAAAQAAHEAERNEWSDERDQLAAEMEDVGRRLDATRDSLGFALRDIRGLEAALATQRSDRQRIETALGAQRDESLRLQRALRALRRIEAEVSQRNRIYEAVIGTFQSLIDAGQLSVAIVEGRMVIQLPQDVLFPSGSATLNAVGQSTIRAVGDALAQIPERRFQVEGHTDNVPISTQRFPNNWELSGTRAITVVRLLLEQGVAPTNLSAAGFGEHQPIEDNESVAGRRANRRIEITMLPNLDVIAELTVPN
jgi:chemotaxis protein MotB